MEYSFTVERRRGYLRAQVQGDNTAKNMRRSLGDAAAACRKNACASILVLEDLAGPSLEVFDIFANLAETGPRAVPAIRRMAYVDLNPAHDYSRTKFGETVAVNRGVNIRVFPDARAAEEWLAAEIAAEEGKKQRGGGEA